MQSIPKEEKPTSENYYEKLFQNYDLSWKVIYTLNYILTIYLTNLEYITSSIIILLFLHERA